MSMTSVLPDVRAFLERRHGLYIDGGWVASSGEARLPVFDPASGEKISSVADATEQDVQRAVQAAKASFLSGPWRGMPPVARERILLRLADLVERDAEILAQLETLEQGKSITLSRILEAGSSQAWIRYVAGLATKITGQSFDVSIPLPPGARYAAYTRKEPVGVVAGIVPWNFPLLIGVWKVLPALAAGCSVVAKPSETTPLTMLRLAELATEAGVPDGAFNVVTGSGGVAGEALVQHPDIAKVSFTGSTPVGKRIARNCASRLARVSLELGGKNPAIVLADADVDRVVGGLTLAGFLNQGQVCAACSRVYAEASIFDRVVAGLQQAVTGMSIGPGMDETAQINPVVSQAHQKRIQSYLERAEKAGAEILSGPPAPEGRGFYVPPALVVNPDDTLPLVREEVFGPVMTVTRVANAEEALVRANDTPFGLAASVWTGSLQAAMELPPLLQAGTVWVNSHVMIDPNMPFGGMKESGVGRDFGTGWLDAFTETKSICVRY
ncbi:aldehyde dehydrogenase family protein [Gluconacetobacter azotocaptans]|uniref:Aldehyde dehydrogenase family protein n=1 Tax=Gluconacetobacter azotocaptans TaxID=142834 RepID=A0A7W4PES7_9PROT|nr:aldehyde dehydrogenase family protein [Gluconacetobacter azotocaptans]MBB2191652.1 aldehyde dehydrogenase family protein [Gluconacetobacter azotocaptans]GBQ34032.1 aldehyde dehydrogenase [Gluconacetobacter azotocaptans DSM 13594]